MEQLSKKKHLTKVDWINVDFLSFSRGNINFIKIEGF